MRLHEPQQPKSRWSIIPIIAGLACAAVGGCSRADRQLEDSGTPPPAAEAGAASGARAATAGASTEAGTAGVPRASGAAGEARVSAGSQGASGGSSAAAGSPGTSDPRKGAVAKPRVEAPSVPVAGTAGPLLRVDLDMQGRPTNEVTELGYRAWPVVAGATLSRSFEGVQFSFGA